MNPKSVRLALWVWILGICLLISLPLRAQVAGATLSGTIADAQGGVLPNARVVAKDVANGATVETIANAAGAYNLPNLRPDDYEVSASSMGFSTVMNKLTLTVGAKMELNFSLPVGQVSQVVTVTEAVPLVETSSSTISGNVAGNEVRELPLNGRDWASLATLEPSVVEARTHLDVTHVGGGGGRGFGDQLSISGSRPTQNSYRLDGALVNDYSNAGPGSVLGKNLGVDAIQEFTVLTSNYSAEYGFTSGGVINAITRSGTNSFHGSAFEFFRNDKLDAANFFVDLAGQPKNKLRQNQFGFTAGYKILKDKLFLFGAYEAVRKSAGLPVTGQQTISDAVRAGTVTNLASGAKVNVASIDPNIQKYLALYPHPVVGAAGCVPYAGPGNVGGCNPNQGFYPFVGNQHASENFVTGRGDYRISDKDSIFATYLRDPSTFTSPLTFNNELQLFSSYRQAIVMEETHIFNPSWVNSFRVAVDRTLNLGGNSPTAVNPAAGDASLGQLPGFFSSGVTLGNNITALPGGIGGGASIQNFWGQIFQVYDDAFHSVGNHSFKFGFAYLNYHVDGYTPLAGYNGAGAFSVNGVFQVNSNTTSVPTRAEGNVPGIGLGGTACFNSVKVPGTPSTAQLNSGANYDASCGSLVNFLTNQPQTASRPFASQAPDIVNKHYLRDNIFSGYFQDDWKFRSNLSFNLGLRYEFATIPSEKYGEVAVMPSPTTILPCGSPVVSPTSPCPSVAAVLAGVNQPAGEPTTVLRNTYWTHNPTKKNFEPRIGFAYQPFKDGKTVIRAGFGVFDSLPLPYELILNSTSSAPWRSTLAGLGSAVLPSPPSIAGCANSAVGTATVPCAATAAGEWPFVVPSLTTQHITQSAGRTFMYVDNDIKRNYVFQYNLNVQRQINPTLSVLVGYTGSRAFHNPFQADSVNTIIPVLIPNVGYVWNKAWSSNNNSGLTAFCTAAANAAGTCAAGNVVNSRRYNPTTGGMFNTMYISKSYYDALQIKVDKRMSHGFQIQGSYTWSKSIDQSSGSTAGDTFQLDPVSEPWYDLSLNKGLSDFDIRHNLTINSLYAIPTTKSLGSIGERALGGWQLGVIARVASGIPIPLVLGSDIAGEGTTTVNPPTLAPGCTAATIADPNYRQNLSYISGFNKSTGPSCLTLTPQTAANLPYCDTATGAAQPRGVAFPAGFCPNIRGNLGRDALIGPGLWSVDFSMVKNNKITEMTNLQFRAEMFNVFNHVNFAPTSATSMLSATDGTINSTFGQITSTQGDNRIIQLALKFVW